MCTYREHQYHQHRYQPQATICTIPVRSSLFRARSGSCHPFSHVSTGSPRALWEEAEAEADGSLDGCLSERDLRRDSCTVWESSASVQKVSGERFQEEEEEKKNLIYDKRMTTAPPTPRFFYFFNIYDFCWGERWCLFVCSRFPVLHRLVLQLLLLQLNLQRSKRLP